MKRLTTCLLCGFALASLGGCTVGEGDGWVKSTKLYIRDCWNGGFDLRPDFFAANPFSDDTQVIRIQRGDNLQEVSDGLMILVTDTQTVREEMLGVPLEVGIPVGVSCPGRPVVYDENPALVNMSLYLHDSCHTQEGATVHSLGDPAGGLLGGTITFTRLFSGDINEQDGSERLTEASFEATFGNPCDHPPGGPWNQDLVSEVTGYFKFYFQRGQPAQPFP
ncbi:MAG TPA: hypothetical protein VFU02_19680 [Polyangiaceae bacterium]|nr:hypothetical protein [Polyangiaceae bacterium]